MATLYVYAHTHWDREWYCPFETFRVQLVQITRQALDDLDAGRLTSFYLDGQAIVLDDVCELAPELTERLKAHMASGALSAGPWYVLPDQMLVSGESLVRNLKLGIATTERFGPASMTGYNPDTFGHTQDLPRILRGFGIDSAFVWRGVPKLHFGPSFFWQSPDGSQVLTYHFAHGYYQTLFHDVAEFDTAQAAQKLLDQIAPYLKAIPIEEGGDVIFDKFIDGALLPAGADHVGPPSHLAELLKQLNAISHDFKVETIQLPQFMELVRKKLSASPAKVTGLVKTELRDNKAAKLYSNAFLLPGVLSTRLYLKQANRRCEYRLARFAEPLLTMLQTTKALPYPGAELGHAWRLLLRNHAHDSICGTSIDAVHDEMMVRYARVHHVLDGIMAGAEQSVSAGKLSPRDPQAQMECLAIFNPGETTLKGAVPYSWFEEPGKAGNLSNSDLVQITSRQSRDELFAGLGRVPYYRIVDALEGWLYLDGVPPFGRTRIDPSLPSSVSRPPACKAHGRSLENGIVHLTVAEKGELLVTVSDTAGKLRSFAIGHKLRDIADAGDTYNFDPIENDKPVWAKLTGTRTKDKGPHAASIVLEWEMKIPENLVQTNSSKADLPVFKRSSKLISTRLETEITLKRGSSIMFFQTNWQNQSTGHRLEVVFETGDLVRQSFSENHFSLVRRKHNEKGHDKAEKLPVERGEEALPDRFPCQRFFEANSQLFLNDGLPEYGVFGQSVSITILRSVDILSRGRMRTRGGGAGPHVLTPGSAGLGPQKVGYAWCALPTKDRAADEMQPPDHVLEAIWDRTCEFENQPFIVPLKKDESEAGNPVSLINSNNPLCRIVSLYTQEDRQAILLRVLNISPLAQNTRLSFNFEFRSAKHTLLSEKEETEDGFVYTNFQDPDSDPGQPLSYIDLELGKYELKTLKLKLDGQTTDGDAAAARKSTRKTKPRSRKMV